MYKRQRKQTPSKPGLENRLQSITKVPGQATERHFVLVRFDSSLLPFVVSNLKTELRRSASFVVAIVTLLENGAP